MPPGLILLQSNHLHHYSYKIKTHFIQMAKYRKYISMYLITLNSQKYHNSEVIGMFKIYQDVQTFG